MSRPVGRDLVARPRNGAISQRPAPRVAEHAAGVARPRRRRSGSGRPVEVRARAAPRGRGRGRRRPPSAVQLARRRTGSTLGLVLPRDHVGVGDDQVVGRRRSRCRPGSGRRPTPSTFTIDAATRSAVASATARSPPAAARASGVGCEGVEHLRELVLARRGGAGPAAVSGGLREGARRPRRAIARRRGLLGRPARHVGQRRAAAATRTTSTPTTPATAPAPPVGAAGRRPAAARRGAVDPSSEPDGLADEGAAEQAPTADQRARSRRWRRSMRSQRASGQDQRRRRRGRRPARPTTTTRATKPRR